MLVGTSYLGAGPMRVMQPGSISTIQHDPSGMPTGPSGNLSPDATSCILAAYLNLLYECGIATRTMRTKTARVSFTLGFPEKKCTCVPADEASRYQVHVHNLTKAQGALAARELLKKHAMSNHCNAIVRQ